MKDLTTFTVCYRILRKSWNTMGESWVIGNILSYMHALLDLIRLAFFTALPFSSSSNIMSNASPPSNSCQPQESNGFELKNGIYQSSDTIPNNPTKPLELVEITWLENSCTSKFHVLAITV